MILGDATGACLPATPSGADIFLGILTVALAAVGASAAVVAQRRTGNWLLLICAAGCVAVLLGVVGQRSFPADAGIRLCEEALQEIPGPWDAGVSLPLVGTRVTPVALAGGLLAGVGLALVLLFEPVLDDEQRRRRAAPPMRRLEEDDAV